MVYGTGLGLVRSSVVEDQRKEPGASSASRLHAGLGLRQRFCHHTVSSDIGIIDINYLIYFYLFAFQTNLAEMMLCPHIFVRFLGLLEGEHLLVDNRPQLL